MRGILITAMLALALAGCATTNARARGLAAPTVAGGSTATPSEQTRVRLQAMVEAARIPPGGLAATGGPATARYEDTEVWRSSSYCDHTYREPSPFVQVSAMRTWQGSTFSLTEIVHGFSTPAGNILDFIRVTATECRTRYTTGTEREAEILTIFDVGPLPGVEASLGVCERTRYPGREAFVWCDAFLVRGFLLANLGARGAPDPAGTIATLRRFMPAAVDALTRV